MTGRRPDRLFSVVCPECGGIIGTCASCAEPPPKTANGQCWCGFVGDLSLREIPEKASQDSPSLLALVDLAHELLRDAVDAVWALAEENERLRSAAVQVSTPRRRRPVRRKGAALVLPAWALRAVSGTFGLRAQDFLGPRTNSNVAAARRVLTVLLAENGWASTAIGSAIRRDHSTVLRGFAVAERLESTDVSFRSQLHHARALAARFRDE